MTPTEFSLKILKDASSLTDKQKKNLRQVIESLYSVAINEAVAQAYDECAAIAESLGIDDVKLVAAKIRQHKAAIRSADEHPLFDTIKKKKER